MQLTNWLLSAALAFVAMCGSTASAQLFDCGGCDLGDAFTIQGDDSPIDFGGWIQTGYHTKGIRAAGMNNNGTGLFNNYPDRIQAQQMWGYVGREADTSGSNDWDVGFRADYVYGTDAPDTQAFGNPAGTFDFGWNNGGAYGHAIPQLYGEVAYGDISLKVGHFFTIVGYEVVQATGNFFYSHAFTQYLAEPFTHTGALATYTGVEGLTVWGGYTQGWDTGFVDNSGDTFLGGFSAELSDDLTFYYTTTIGDFGGGAGGSDAIGYSQSIVLDWQICDRWEYVFQSDYIANDRFANRNARGPVPGNHKIWGFNNYLFYTINDCWKAGVRAEYFHDPRMSATGATTTHLWGYTAGVNYRPCANVVIRPEIRYHDAAGGNAAFSDQTTVGTDVVITF